MELTVNRFAKVLIRSGASSLAKRKSYSSSRFKRGDMRERPPGPKRKTLCQASGPFINWDSNSRYKTTKQQHIPLYRRYFMNGTE